EHCDELDDKNEAADGGAAIPATSAKREKACDGNEVAHREHVSAMIAGGTRHCEGAPFRKTQRQDAQKTADERRCREHDPEHRHQHGWLSGDGRRTTNRVCAACFSTSSTS